MLFGTLNTGGKLDYLKLYNQEEYLFSSVKESFKENKKLSAFDFFCIIIWKANRAKSKVAHNLVERNDCQDLNTIVEMLTTEIANAESAEMRMRVMIVNWKFRLPMASAVLTVLYPDEFTVYDRRVCDELENFHNVQNRTKFERLWQGYQEYLNAVRDKEPAIDRLRDKDRTLWAKSFEKQLHNDIASNFRKNDG